MNVLLLALLIADLGAVRAEPNLEKRAEKALENASLALDGVRDAYRAGDSEKFKSSLQEANDSVELCLESLRQTGKDPRKGGIFKKSELKMRELVRRLTGLRDLVGYEDREAVEKVRNRVQQIHDDLLAGILNRKKK
jgi:hypothetical protein